MAKPTEVTLKGVRASYPALDKPRAFDEKQEPKFSVMLLLPPGYDLAPLKAAMQAAVAEKFGATPPAAKDRAFNGNPLHKMEEKQDAETGEFPSGMVAGGYFITPNNKYQPMVFGRDAKPTKDAAMVYPGCEINCHINVYAWNYKGKWGVSYSLEAVQFVRDGERLDGRTVRTDIFAPLEGETPPAAAGAGGGDQNDLFG